MKIRQKGTVLVLVVGVIASGAYGQADSLERPSDDRPDLPSFQPRTEGKILPPVTLPNNSSTDSMTAGHKVFIRGYRFVGNHAFSTEKLQSIAADYSNRQVSYSDLYTLRNSITLAYVNAGMVNSGAMILDQKVDDGIIEIRIVEGQLTDVLAQTDGRLKLGVVKKRILRSASPLNVFNLEQELQLIQQDPRVKRLNARLLPGNAPGEARLDLSVVEARPWSFGFGWANDQPEAVGEAASSFGFQHLNLLGFSDTLSISATKTEGLDKGEASYRIPLGSYGTSLGVRWSESESEVVVKPFDEFAIEGKSSTLSVELAQPLWRHPDSNLDVFLRAEARRSYTSLLGFGFSFTPGPEEGLARARVLRVGQDYTRRSASQVFALRSTFSFGLDVDNATVHEDDLADGKFRSVLVQAQLARKVELFDSRIIARLDGQWSDDALLGMEQFAMGGQRTVRGYVQNTLVADKGLVVSLEWRVPVWRSGEGTSSIDIAPFVDYGKGWNSGPDDPADDILGSVGLGAILTLGKRVRAEVWYGDALETVEEPIGSSLQEDGWHISLSVTLP